MQKTWKKAFSLIELSIVILIIGILIAGVIQGSIMYNKFRLHIGRSLTKNSPVSGIKDLVLWYETSLEESFLEGEAANGNELSTWKDINTQRFLKLTATATSNAKPIFTENVINGLPVVRFDGSNDFMTFTGTDLLNTDYVIFVVGTKKKC